MVDSPHVIFIGRGAALVAEPEGGEESGEVAWIPLNAVRDLIAKGEVLSSGTLLALLHILAFGVEPEQPRGSPDACSSSWAGEPTWSAHCTVTVTMTVK
ncbi:hypothetical protein [Actinoplanes campanulatus]|uniref:hypothetical protein n=1 Tax=Actinoplanes campanulatus TaxID=113559 RepID=UPI001670FF84|nr:hypothetical protein [Actinoplanes campanulatus]